MLSILPQNVSKSGAGRLEFEKVRDHTIVRSKFSKSPLHFLNPKNSGKMAWVYASSLGGGLVGGDHIDIHLHARKKSELLLLSQSSTKIYRSEIPSSHSLRAVVEEEAILISMPDPIVCYRGSSFTQNQNYDLKNRASLLLVDAFYSGRYTSGERWCFKSFRNRIQVTRNENTIFLESLFLDSSLGKLSMRLGRFNCFCVVLLFGSRLEEYGVSILNEVGSLPVSARADLLVTASPLATEGTILRIAGISTEEVMSTMRHFLDFVPAIVGDNPWTRKA